MVATYNGIMALYKFRIIIIITIITIIIIIIIIIIINTTKKLSRSRRTTAFRWHEDADCPSNI